MIHRGTVAYRGKGNIYANITNRCNCACTFCLREFSDEVYGYSLLLEEEPSVDEIMRAIELELQDGLSDEVVFCGLGEPTLRLPEVLAVTQLLTERRIRSRLNTNGLGRLANPGVAVVDELVHAGLGGVSVSLNAADPDTYDALCRPMYGHAFWEVLAFASECRATGLQTQVSVVNHPEVDLEACAVIADRLGAQLKIRALAVPPRRTAAPADGSCR